MIEKPSRDVPLFSRCEYWRSHKSVQEVVHSVSNAFSPPIDVRSGDDWVEIRTGSAAWYRVWGELFPWGRKNAPVCLRIEAEESDGGSKIHAHAKDDFGRRITDRSFFGAEKTFENIITKLMTEAEGSAGVTSKEPGPGDR